MKIEIILSDNINEKCTGMTCFEAPKFISNAIHNEKPIQGVVIIDNNLVKFCFSSMGMDGNIFTGDDGHRTIIKYLIPLYVYNKMKTAMPLPKRQAIQ